MAKTDGRYEFDKVDYDTEVETTLNQISNNFQTIDDRLGKRGRVTKTLPVGTTVQTFDRAGVLDVRMRGRTLVNLLGNKGNCEDVEGWSKSSVSNILELDSDNKTAGEHSFKLIWSNNSSATTSVNINIFDKIDTDSHYLVAADLKNGNATRVRIAVDITETTGDRVNSNLVESTDDFEIAYLTIAPATFTRFIVHFLVTASGQGQYGYCDSIRVYKITPEEKDFIDGLSVSEAQAYIAANYPYVDSMQAIRNPYVIASGRNLVPTSVDGWEQGTIGVTTGGLSNSLTRIRTKDFIPVAKGQTYYFNATHPYIPFRVFCYKEDGTYITYVSEGVVTIPDGCAKIKITLRKEENVELTPYEILDAKPMLNVGDTALPFEEHNETYKFFHSAQDEEDFVLRSNVDGSVADELNGDVITRRFKEVVLDGTLGWGYGQGSTGYKVVKLTVNGAVNGSGIVSKYDGKILPNVQGGTTADNQFLNGISNTLFVNIPKQDSGWGDDYTPTANEIKAYFNGWKMYRSGSGYGTSVPYNGEGQKGWFYRGSEDGSPQGMTTTLPTDMAPINAYWKPYRLQYELAEPVTVKAFSEGDAITHEGVNQITVGAGIVVRESNVPALSNGLYRINDTEYGSPLKYRLADFYKVYQDGYDDNNWRNNETNAFGRYKATKRDFAHNPEAAYSVTYFVLDKHLFGIPAPVDVTTSGTELDTIESLVEYVAHLKREIDVLKRGE